MYKTKGPDGRLNICGLKVAKLRGASETKCSQKDLAEQLQLAGMDVGKNAVQCIESGNRFVTDIELKIIAGVFGITVDELLTDE